MSRKSVIVSIFGIILFLTFFFFPTGSKSLVPAQEVISLPQISSGLPLRLKIPQINVDAPMEHLGIAEDGTMDVPKGPLEVAWFNLGPRPGEVGSAVMAGHSGYKDRREAVFDNLYKLKKGDKIYVEDANRVMMTFVVREIRSYSPKADAREVFTSSDGLKHLNLITCTGIWNEQAQTRSERLVVFTDKE